jgi:predicted nucleotidyltransferase
MGMIPQHPSEALFTKTQRRVLGLLFGRPDQSHYANEIVRSAGVGIGAVLRELDGLVASKLVVMARIGNQKHFQANRASPVFEELAAIARKILPDGEGQRALAAHESRAAYSIIPRAQDNVSRAALVRLCRKFGIRKIGLFGSAARGELKSGSDIDLLVEFETDSKATLFDYPSLRGELSALFGNRPVDIVPPEVLRNPHRRKAILADLKVLHETRRT